VIRQNALRLLAALSEFLDELAGPRAANLACRVEARVEHGVSREAVALTAVDGVGSRRADRLADAGITSPAAIRAAGTAGLSNVGMGEGVAERIVEAAGAVPQIRVDWGTFPERVAVGENELCEVAVTAVGGGARVGIRVTVNDVEMTATTTYLDGETTVPVGVFGPRPARRRRTHLRRRGGLSGPAGDAGSCGATSSGRIGTCETRWRAPREAAEGGLASACEG